MVANVTVSDKRGWSQYHHISSTGSSKLHFFMNSEAKTRSVCGLKELSGRTSPTNKFVAYRKYNIDKLCKRCSSIVIAKKASSQRVKALNKKL